jgi:hypothetical protein
VRFGDEHYVKVYTRETPTILALSWQARAVLHELFKKVDPAGLLECGPLGITAVAMTVRIPADVVKPALEELRAAEIIEWVGASARTVLIPRFREAQEAKKERGLIRQDSREKAKAEARAQALGFIQPAWDRWGPLGTAGDPPSPSPSPSPSPDKETTLSADADLPLLAPGLEVLESELTSAPGSPPSPLTAGPSTAPTKVSPKPAEASALQALWNSIVKPPLHRWEGMPEKRRKAAQRALREHTLDEWRAVISAINAWPWARGENDRGWSAGPDYFLRADTYTQFVEGKFNAKNGSSPPVKWATGEDIYARQEREERERRARTRGSAGGAAGPGSGHL